jgi:hypothetical protein
MLEPSRALSVWAVALGSVELGEMSRRGSTPKATCRTAVQGMHWNLCACPRRPHRHEESGIACGTSHRTSSAPLCLHLQSLRRAPTSVLLTRRPKAVTKRTRSVPGTLYSYFVDFLLIASRSQRLCMLVGCGAPTTHCKPRTRASDPRAQGVPTGVQDEPGVRHRYLIAL